MRARRIIAIAAAALVAFVAWLATRGADVTGAPPPPSRPARMRPAPPAPIRDVATTSVPVEPDDPTPVIDTTHEVVHTIGRRCWAARTPRPVPAGQPDDTVGRLELRLHVTIAGGLARVASSGIVSNRRLTDELRDCIVAGVGAATWPVAAPDGTIEITELFRMGDYTAPSGDTPPPPLPSPPGAG